MKRNLILWCGLGLLLVAGVLMLGTPAGASSTLTVTTTSDTVANDGLCSLREAIIAANTDAASGDATGECPAGSGADTIDLSSYLPQPATFVLTNTGPGEDNAGTGDLDIVGALTINGAGTGTTILDGNGQDRVFEIRPGAHVTISGMTIRNGDSGADVGGGIKVLGALTMSDSTVESNHGDGIRNQGGSLTLNATDVISNTGGYGVYTSQGALSYTAGLVGGNQAGGVYSAASSTTLNNLNILYNSGSGVRNTGATTSHLTMHYCVVMSNTAASGAGIYNEGVGAIATIYDTRISGNTATAPGGGLLNNGLMTLSRSTIDHNQARSGGGIDHVGGNLHLENDTFSSNQAADNGGGLYNRSSAVLTNVTFDGNTANGPDTGGNIFNDTAQLSIVNTIVAYSDTDGNCFNSGGSIQSLGHNLESADTCGFGAAGDLVNTDPLLGPLQDNGGATWTHALPTGSPAIDAGDNSNCPSTDQRGVSRPQGTISDIGAYESGEGVDLSISKQRQGTGTVVPGGRITYTIAITSTGPTTPITATVIDTWSPVTAVVGVDAPGCSVDLGSGTITCTQPSLGIGTALLPNPHVVFTTSTAFSGTLTNVATVTTTGGITDTNPANNTGDPIPVTIAPPGTPPVTEADLSIGEVREGTGSVAAGEQITYTITVTNAGPAAPVTVTVVDTWSPVTAVVGVDAPGCSVDLGSGTITCTQPSLGMGTALLPNPHVVFTTSAAFSGTLTNAATVTTIGGITDTNLADNASDPVMVTLIKSGNHSVYLAIVLKSFP